MTIVRSRVLGVLLLAALSLPACVTEMKVGNKDVDDPERYEAYTKGEETKLGDPNDKRIASAVDSVGFERGPKLLQTLQFLIDQRQLAIPHVVAALPKASPRAQASYLYVLGFTRTPESHQALVDHLDASDIIVRYEAAAGLMAQGDMTAVPALIKFLDSDDRQMRYKAIESLRAGTGKDFGYQFAAPEDLRSASIVQWESWWKSERDRLMVRPAER